MRRVKGITYERFGTHAGFDWLVIASDMGHRCGYIRIPEDHPWHGKGYDDIDVDVHGGLTFSQVAEFTSPGYWIGFDCNHAWDIPDPDIASDEYVPFILTRAVVRSELELNRKPTRDEVKQTLIADTLAGNLEGKIRTADYVEAECKKLAEAAREAREGKKEDI
jgi:hypothetical protein